MAVRPNRNMTRGRVPSKKNSFFMVALGFILGSLTMFFSLQIFHPPQNSCITSVEDRMRCLPSEYDTHTLELEAGDVLDEGYFDFELVE